MNRSQRRQELMLKAIAAGIERNEKTHTDNMWLDVFITAEISIHFGNESLYRSFQRFRWYLKHNPEISFLYEVMSE